MGFSLGMSGWFNIRKSNNTTRHIIKGRRKNHNHPADTEEALDQTQHPFMMETLNKVGIENISSTQNQCHSVGNQVFFL
jgi:hypothetical protein